MKIATQLANIAIYQLLRATEMGVVSMLSMPTLFGVPNFWARAFVYNFARCFAYLVARGRARVGRCGVVSNIKCTNFHRNCLVEFPSRQKVFTVTVVISIVEDDCTSMCLCVPSLVPCGCQLSDYSLHDVYGTNST